MSRGRQRRCRRSRRRGDAAHGTNGGTPTASSQQSLDRHGPTGRHAGHTPKAHGRPPRHLLVGEDALAGQTAVRALADPHLADVLGIDGGTGGVQSILVQQTIDRGRKEHNGHALADHGKRIPARIIVEFVEQHQWTIVNAAKRDELLAFSFNSLFLFPQRIINDCCCCCW